MSGKNGGTPPTAKKAIPGKSNLGINFARRYNAESHSRENINRLIEAPHLKGGSDECGGRRGSGESGRSTIRCRGEDGEVREMEIVSAKEKLSIFQKTCPVLPTKVALLCAVLNLIPGFGTAIGALSYGLCYKIPNSETKNPASGATTDNEEDLYSPKQRVGYGMLAAFLQLLFAPLIFGWIWSIRYGVFMVKKANEMQEDIMNKGNSKV